MSALGNCDADDVQEKTGIPVVVIPGSDQMMDENVYETFRIMGEVYQKEDRAEELIAYLEETKRIWKAEQRIFLRKKAECLCRRSKL